MSVTNMKGGLQSVKKIVLGLSRGLLSDAEVAEDVIESFLA